MRELHLGKDLILSGESMKTIDPISDRFPYPSR